MRNTWILFNIPGRRVTWNLRVDGAKKWLHDNSLCEQHRRSSRWIMMFRAFLLYAETKINRVQISGTLTLYPIITMTVLYVKNLIGIFTYKSYRSWFVDTWHVINELFMLARGHLAWCGPRSMLFVFSKLFLIPRSGIHNRYSYLCTLQRSAELIFKKNLYIFIYFAVSNGIKLNIFLHFLKSNILWHMILPIIIMIIILKACH